MCTFISQKDRFRTIKPPLKDLSLLEVFSTDIYIILRFSDQNHILWGWAALLLGAIGGEGVSGAVLPYTVWPSDADEHDRCWDWSSGCAGGIWHKRDYPL